MKNQTMLDRLNAKRSQIESLQTGIRRCEETIAASDAHQIAVTNLKKSRSSLIAQAFIENENANTKQIDLKIAEAESKHNAAITRGQTARDAISILQEQVEKARAEFDDLSQANREAALVVCDQAFEAAIKKYGKGFELVVEALYDLRAAGSVHKLFGGGNLLRIFEYLVRDIKEAGLISFSGTITASNAYIRTPSIINNLGPNSDLVRKHESVVMDLVVAAGVDVSS